MLCVPLFETTVLQTQVCVCVCVSVSPHLHVGSPQGHAVSGQPQNNDYDVERGLEEQVHLTVHITERDVAHCPVWNTLGVCVCVCVCVCEREREVCVQLLSAPSVPL